MQVWRLLRPEGWARTSLPSDAGVRLLKLRDQLVAFVDVGELARDGCAGYRKQEPSVEPWLRYVGATPTVGGSRSGVGRRAESDVGSRSSGRKSVSKARRGSVQVVRQV
jgi:hypothetical protein